jgi:hypothetical protein
MADVNKLIQILNRREFGGSGKNTDTDTQKDPIKKEGGGKKVEGTGLVLYGGGKEKTPTGRNNAFTESGLSKDDLLAYAAKYDLPTTSNKEFQQAQYDLLNSTARGRGIIKAMEEKYGKPAAGTYADGMLGARTIDMMRASAGKPEEPVLLERTPPGLKMPPPKITDIPRQKSKWDGYGPWVITSSDNAVPDRVYTDWDKYQEHIGRGLRRGLTMSGSQGEGQFTNPNTGRIIPQKEWYTMNYDDDVFSGFDLPNEEKDFAGTGLEKGGFNEEFERTRNPLGLIDKETGKFVPYRMDPGTNRRYVNYIMKMTKEYPELFDLNKVANSNMGSSNRKLSPGKNQFHPDNNPLSGDWGNQNFGRRE